MKKEVDNTKPKKTPRLWRRIKFLALLVGFVLIFLLVAMIRVLVQSQLESYEVPDPMAYFQTGQANSRDTHAQIKAQHARVWIVRRSAFLPILNMAELPPSLLDAAEAYTNDMRGRLKSATATLLAPQTPRMGNRVHPLSASSHKSAALFSKEADKLNPNFQQVWRDFFLRTNCLQDFRTEGRPGWVTFMGPDGLDMKVSNSVDAQMIPDVSELPPTILATLEEWQAAQTKISDSLLKAPLDFGDCSFMEGLRHLERIDKAYASALASFLPRFVDNDEFVILPDGIEAWFETRSRAKLALCVSKGKWISAAWTCHDDLKDHRQFAYYLKKAGWKGRQILAQETLEDKASDLAKSVEDGLRDALRATRTQRGGL
jgi:hypothetical protein